VVVYLDGTRSAAVIGRDGRLLSSHHLGERSAERLERILRSLPGGAEETTPAWTWCGPGAGDEAGLAAVRDPLLKTWPGSASVCEQPAGFLARALAVRALERDEGRCNLRGDELEHPAVAARRMRRAVGNALGYLGAGLLLIAVNLAWQINGRRFERQVRDGFYAYAREAAGISLGAARGRDALKRSLDAIEERIRRTDPFVRALAPSLMRTLQPVVEAGARNRIKYETVSLRDDHLSAAGVADSWEACERLQQSLNAAGVRVRLSRRDSLSDGAVVFTISSVKDE
jgi:hypothetical protein